MALTRRLIGIAFLFVAVLSLCGALGLSGCDRVPKTPAFKTLTSSCDGREIRWRVHCYPSAGSCDGKAWRGNGEEYDYHPEEWFVVGYSPDDVALELAEAIKQPGKLPKAVPDFDSGVQECPRPKLAK
jgi:hypothetical protein